VLGVMKQQRMMGEQDVVDALKFGKELPQLKDQFQILVEEIDSLEYKKMVSELFYLLCKIKYLQQRIR
jgi:hypothetical protein